MELVEQSDYKLKTPHFEGPLELLLELIEKRKLHINDFSLSQVADEYINFIRSMSAFPIGDVAQFLVVASTLVLIKSKALLPQLNLEIGEEGSIDDLKRRLMLYEKFRSLAQVVRGAFGKSVLFFRIPKERAPVFSPHVSITQESLSLAMKSVVSALPKKTKVPEVTVKKVVSIEEMMDRLTMRIQRALKVSFTDFAGHGGGPVVSREQKVHIVVGFLAMLELVKQGVLHVTQELGFGEIHMEPHELATPSYGDISS